MDGARDRFLDHSLSRHGGQIHVTVKVKNTGSKDGDEVVQLYIHDPVADIVQPVRPT